MKISGRIIQPRNIVQHDDTTFLAKYRGKDIYVSSDHGLGEPEYVELTRYNIVVTDLATGLLDVNTFEDCANMIEAIEVALKGACLL